MNINLFKYKVYSSFRADKYKFRFNNINKNNEKNDSSDAASGNIHANAIRAHACGPRQLFSTKHVNMSTIAGILLTI